MKKREIEEDEKMSTESFLARFAGCLDDDFPDDIDCEDLPGDSPRESMNDCTPPETAQAQAVGSVICERTKSSTTL